MVQRRGHCEKARGEPKATLSYYCTRPFFLGGHLGPQCPWGQDPFSWGIWHWLKHSLLFSAESVFLNLFATHLANTMFSKEMTSYMVFHTSSIIIMIWAVIVILLKAFNFLYFCSRSSYWQCPKGQFWGKTLLFFLHSFNQKRSRMIPPKSSPFLKSSFRNCPTSYHFQPFHFWGNCVHTFITNLVG